jgi:phenylpropionate dioxygenase-like ring-hydroxylating dioxygenase large terminal subunit
MFLKNCWYMGGWDHEVMDGKLLERRLLNDPVVFYRGESGQIVALDNRCCHRGAKLSQGRIEGDCVRCMYHGLKYDPSGKCVQIPGQERIPPQLGVRSYPVVEKQHIMWIWMGDPALADTSKIIDVSYLDDPKWKGIPAYLHYDANYLLIVDNLSDFGHLAFVHTHTLGGSEEYAYVTKPVAIERLPDGFRVERWHMNSDPPPFYRKVIPNKDDKVDRRNIGHMVVPGIFFLESLFAPAGKGAEQGERVEGTREFRNCQFMTPETEGTTHFFWNYLNDFEGEDYTVSMSLVDSLREGFMEDKHIIEAQQKMLDADPSFKLIAVAADVALSHFRYVMDKLIREEQAGVSAPQPATAIAAE